MDRDALHTRARERGVNIVLYWIARSILQPFFMIYFRMSRTGVANIPKSGPVILASNHRSFLDPFVIGCCLRRPIYYVAKKELFSHKLGGWFLSRLGAFPVNREKGDAEMLATAEAILARGDCVLIFPEGTRVRPGPLGKPKTGAARLSLISGAPVVPVAVKGTEAIRKGFRVRPHKVRITMGEVLEFGQVPREEITPTMAITDSDRIWAPISQQWEALGGVPPLRKVAVVGAGSAGTALAVLLARAGVEVLLACRGAEQVKILNETRENAAYLPGVDLPDRVQAVRAAELDSPSCDIVCFAVPSRSLPAALAAHAPRMHESTGIVLLSKGLVPHLGDLPAEYTEKRAAGHSILAIGGPAHAAGALEKGAAFVLASKDAILLAQLAAPLREARTYVETTDDVAGVEMAGCAKNVAALAAAAAMGGGPNAAGAAAGRVWAEIVRWAESRGARLETFAGLAGAGDLVATVLAEGSRNRRAGEKLASGAGVAEIEKEVGQAIESLDTVPLLAAKMTQDGARAPETRMLARLVAGQIDPERWRERVTTTRMPRRKLPSRSSQA
ncbi:MAG: 1-acyl-sn-glycerol-3-phosphate acyltransferase [Actinomycetes bacterium]